MVRNIAVLVLFAFPAVWAQTAPTPSSFEVASVKPSAADFHGVAFQIQPGGLRISGANLKMLVVFAYNVRDFQVSGGPGWINSDRYDVVAKSSRADSAAAPADPRKLSDEQRNTRMEETRQRLRALLEERFHLMAHRETKEQPVYALVVAKGGSKLQPSQATGPGRLQMAPAEIVAEAMDMQMLAGALANAVGRPVLDKTGIAGKFDVKLTWTPDPTLSGGAFGPPPGAVDVPPPGDPNGPSIFTAVQQQLGLRLESEKGPAEMIVIDRVEKPSEN